MIDWLFLILNSVDNWSCVSCCRCNLRESSTRLGYWDCSLRDNRAQYFTRTKGCTPKITLKHSMLRGTGKYCRNGHGGDNHLVLSTERKRRRLTPCNHQLS